jgi:hypothetical protein
VPDEQLFSRDQPSMPTFRLTRISQPGLLAKISPEALLEFLKPMREHLEQRGFEWPSSESDQIDYERLGHILHFPRDGPPPRMILPLVLVDEMSTDHQMDRLLAAAIKRKIKLSLAGSCSPSDVAVQVWLQAPRLLEELHAENYTIRQRNFCSFAGIAAEPRTFLRSPIKPSAPWRPISTTALRSTSAAAAAACSSLIMVARYGSWCGAAPRSSATRA